MTERAYTTTELQVELERLRVALGPDITVSLIQQASKYPELRNRAPDVSIQAMRGAHIYLICVTEPNIERAIQAAWDALAIMPKGDDAWAIIGAEAA